MIHTILLHFQITEQQISIAIFKKTYENLTYIGKLNVMFKVHNSRFHVEKKNKKIQYDDLVNSPPILKFFSPPGHSAAHKDSIKQR